MCMAQVSPKNLGGEGLSIWDAADPNDCYYTVHTKVCISRAGQAY